MLLKRFFISLFSSALAWASCEAGQVGLVALVLLAGFSCLPVATSEGNSQEFKASR